MRMRVCVIIISISISINRAGIDRNIHGDTTINAVGNLIANIIINNSNVLSIINCNRINTSSCCRRNIIINTSN